MSQAPNRPINENFVRCLRRLHGVIAAVIQGWQGLDPDTVERRVGMVGDLVREQLVSTRLLTEDRFG